MIKKKKKHQNSEREARWHAASFEPFEERHQCDRDDQRRRYGHEELGASAQREGKPDDQREAGDQGQRGEQPVALDGDRLGERARLLGHRLGRVLAVLSAGPRVHRGAAYPATQLLASRVVPLVRLERTLR